MYLTSLVLLIKTHHLTSLLENVFIQSVSGFILCDIFYLCGNAKSYLSVTSDNISSSVIKSSAAATQHWRSVRVWMEPDGTCSLNEVLQFVGGIIYNTYTLPPYAFLYLLLCRNGLGKILSFNLGCQGVSDATCK